MKNLFFRDWFVASFCFGVFCYFSMTEKSFFTLCLLPILFGVGIATSLFLTREKFSKKLEFAPHKIKLGLDVHGCISYDPKFFSALTKLIVNAGGEIHVLTGPHITDKVKNELKNFNITYTHLFSIADYYKNKPEVVMEYDAEGRPWVSDELWNKAKGQYAAEKDLDLVLDDTLEYGQYFTTAYAHCTIINKSGIPRKPKAKMPPSMISKQLVEKEKDKSAKKQ